MKRFLVLILILVLTGSAWAIPTETTIKENRQLPSDFDGLQITPSPLLTSQKGWNVLATVASEDEEPNDLAVGERTYLTVKALAEGGDSKIMIVKLPRWNCIRFRCIGITDNSDVNFVVYSGTLGRDADCELVKTAILNFTIGTQVSTTSTYEMADTLTVTSYCTLKTILSVSPLNELVAEAGWDLLGDDILVIVSTTVGCDAKLIGKGF